MANSIWSDKIQGILNLDLSREIKFRDDRKELFLYLMGITPGRTIADIGCGTGAITRKLSNWLGDTSKIIGIDRDTNFINFARGKANKLNLNNISYFEGDALKLPLEDNSVDATISHTVIEHVPNREFLLEQKRVCTKGGRVTVMFARPDKHIQTEPELMPKRSNRELELMDRLYKDYDKIHGKYEIAKYWPDPVKLPMLFEELGFKNIKIDAVSIPIVIDDSRNSEEEKIAMIEAERAQTLEGVEMGHKANNDFLPSAELEELRNLIDNRFDERIKLLKENKRIWDYAINSMQIVSGEA